MENIQSSKDFCKNLQNLSLKGYYHSLPERIAPKQRLLDEIQARCGVTLSTARNWVLYGIKPKNAEHVKVISEITGIKEEDLWED